jgi:hypothetical protein
MRLPELDTKSKIDPILGTNDYKKFNSNVENKSIRNIFEKKITDYNFEINIKNTKKNNINKLKSDYLYKYRDMRRYVEKNINNFYSNNNYSNQLLNANANYIKRISIPVTKNFKNNNMKNNGYILDYTINNFTDNSDYFINKKNTDSYNHKYKRFKTVKNKIKKIMSGVGIKLRAKHKKSSRN